MPNDPKLFLPSADHFLKHPDSIAARLAREGYARALQRLAESVDDEEDDGPDWLDLDEHSTDEEIDAACRNLSSLITPPPAPFVVRTPAVIRACPLGWESRRMDMFGSERHDFRRVTSDERERCARARVTVPAKHLGVVDLAWEVARDDARYRPMTRRESGQPSWKYPPGSPAHHHAELEIYGIVVHVDLIDVQKSGPGRSIREVRIFVDGQLAGRGGQCGCSLGFGGGDAPAVAQIASERALTVDLIAGRQTPVAELWQVGV